MRLVIGQSGTFQVEPRSHVVGRAHSPGPIVLNFAIIEDEHRIELGTSF